MISCRPRSCNQSSRSGTLHRTVLRGGLRSAGGSCGCQGHHGRYTEIRHRNAQLYPRGRSVPSNLSDSSSMFYWSNGVFCSFHEDTNIHKLHQTPIQRAVWCFVRRHAHGIAWQLGMPSFQEPPAPSSLVCPGLPARYCTTTKQTHKQTHKHACYCMFKFRNAFACLHFRSWILPS